MKSAANFNKQLFKSYLHEFSQLEAQHLQEILNKAVSFSEKNDTPEYAESWKQIAELIQSKFPEMKAEDPFNS